MTGISATTPLPPVYELFFTRITDAACVVGFDGRIQHVNPSFERATGWSEAEVTGRPYAELLHPDDIHSHATHMVTIVSGQSINLYDERIRCKDGHYLWLGWSATPLPEQGVYLGMAHEITARKEAELRAQEQQILLDKMTSMTPDLVYVVDLSVRQLVYANAKLVDRLGYTLEQAEAIGPDFLPRLLHPDDAALYSKTAQSVAAGLDGQIYEVTYRVQHADGSWRWMHSRIQVFKRDENGNVLQVLGVAQDLTEERRTLENLAYYKDFMERVTAAVPDLLYLFDLRTMSNSYANHSLFTVLGYSEAQLLHVKNGVMDLVHPEDIERVVAHMAGLSDAQDGVIYEQTYRIRHADGSWRWLHSRDMVFERDEQGKACVLLGIGQDVTRERGIALEIERHQRFLENMTHALPEAIFVYDVQERKVVFATRTHLEIAGYPAGMVSTPETLTPLIHPDDREHALSHLMSMAQIEDDRVYEVTYRVRRPDGTWCWIYSRSSVYERDAQGRVKQIIGSGYDISRRKELESQLEEKTHFLESVLRAIPELVYIVDARVSQSLFESRSMANILGYTPEAFEAIDGYKAASIVHPDDMALMATVGEELMQNPSGTADREIRLRAADGTWRWFSTRTGVFETDSMGNPSKLIGFNASIDARKQAEEQLRLSEAMLRQIAENIDGALWLADVDEGYRVLYHNNRMPVRMEQSLDEFLNDHELLMRYVLPEYHEPLKTILAKRENAFQQLDFEYRNPAQELLWLRLRMFPVADSSGRVVRMVKQLEDITTRKNTAREILRVQAEKERVQLTHKFITDSSHDFRTPLSIIKASAYLVRKHTDEEKRLHSLREIEAQADRITVMLDDMLALLRLEELAGKPTAIFDIADLVRQACASQSSSIELHRHFITVEAAQPVMVRGYSMEVRTALLNLLQNAIHYTPDGGEIHVSVIQVEGQVVVEVEDNGVGIPPEVQSHIFESFYRADDARRTEKGGTGLGLAIVHKVAELHHGTVKVSSTVGVGSTFSIILPLVG